MKTQIVIPTDLMIAYVKPEICEALERIKDATLAESYQEVFELIVKYADRWVLDLVTFNPTDPED